MGPGFGAFQGLGRAGLLGDRCRLGSRALSLRREGVLDLVVEFRPGISEKGVYNISKCRIE